MKERIVSRLIIWQNFSFLLKKMTYYGLVLSISLASQIRKEKNLLATIKFA